MKRIKSRYGCPVELSLDVLGGKWKSVILARLKDGPLRYGELRTLVSGLSDKMLTERLHDLQAAGLVATQPAGERTAYTLTERGESLRPVLQALYEWGEKMAESDGVIIEPGTLAR